MNPHQRRAEKETPIRYRTLRIRRNRLPDPTPSPIKSKNRNRRAVLPPGAGEEAEAEPTEQGGRGEGSRRLRGEASQSREILLSAEEARGEARGLGGGALVAAGQELRARARGRVRARWNSSLLAHSFFGLLFFPRRRARQPRFGLVEWWSVAVGAGRPGGYPNNRARLRCVGRGSSAVTAACTQSLWPVGRVFARAWSVSPVAGPPGAAESVVGSGGSASTMIQISMGFFFVKTDKIGPVHRNF
jgi:hypothetical protein